MLAKTGRRHTACPEDTMGRWIEGSKSVGKKTSPERSKLTYQTSKRFVPSAKQREFYFALWAEAAGSFPLFFQMTVSSWEW